MKVRRITIERMPGVEGVEVDGLGDGVTVVVGRNESGKTSLVRAVRALLWGHEPAGERPYDVAAEVDGAVVGEREGGRTTWRTAGGASAEAPPVPDGRHAGCFAIELDDLGAGGGDDATGAELARRLRSELNGGVDVAAARGALDARTPRGGAERTALRAARDDYAAARRRHRATADAAQRLAELEERRARVEAEGLRLPLLQRAQAWRDALDEVAGLDARAAGLPVPAAQLAAVQDHDRATWAQLLRARDVAERGAQAARERLDATNDAIDRSPLPGPLPPERAAWLALRVGELERAQGDLRRLAIDAAAARGRLGEGEEPTTDTSPTPADIELARRLAVEQARLQVDAGRAGAPPGRDPATRAATVATTLLGAAAAAWVATTASAVVGWGTLALLLACGAVALRPRRAAGAQHERRREVDRRVGELASRLGVAPPEELGAFADWLHLVAAQRDARADERVAAQALAAARRDVHERAAGLARELAPYVEIAVTDAASARAAHDALLRASDVLEEACRAAPDLLQALDDAEADACAARAHVDAFLAARGLDPATSDTEARAQLERLWEHAPAHRDIELARATAARRRDEAAATVPLAEQARWKGLDRGELDAAVASAAQAHARHLQLVAELAGARAEVEHVGGGFELTDVLAARDDAGAALVARRDEALRLQTAAFLVDRAARSYERDHAPPLVHDVNRLLGAATGGRCSVAVDGTGLAAHHVVDGRSRPRSLARLSSGTRAQLLIAARVAFARHVERGARLPIFVDEALATTDPERFDAIVAALAALARDDDRQVVVLTSEPAHADRVATALARLGHAPLTVRELAPPRPPRRTAPRLRRPDDLRIALEHAGISTDTWHDRLWERLQVDGGQASALVTTLRAASDASLRRFTRVDDLEAAFVQGGYLPATATRGEILTDPSHPDPTPKETDGRAARVP